MFERTQQLQKELKRSEQRKELRHKEAAKRLASTTEKVAVSIPPIYRKRLGQNLPLTLGLQTITIPVDGKTYMVPKGFAEILQKHLHQINVEEIRSQGEWDGHTGDVSAIGPIPGK